MLKNNSVVLTLAKAIKEFLYHCRKKQKELLVNQLNMLSFCSARGISGTQGGGGSFCIAHCMEHSSSTDTKLDAQSHDSNNT